MRRRGRPKAFAPTSTVERNVSGNTYISGTSTRPLISFTDDQPPTILEDVPHQYLPHQEIPSSEKLTEESQAESMEDDRVYCLCKRRYDGRAMIACDRCDNWYHNDCVGIDDDMVELVDVFICPTCAPGAEKVTTWKTQCARPGCKSATRALSKYCTDWCGLKTASNRLDQVSIDQLAFWDSVHSVNRPQGNVQIFDGLAQDGSPSSIEENCLWKSLQRDLEEITNRRFNLDSQIQLVTSRLTYLHFAIHRWENMCVETARALASQDNSEEVDQPATEDLVTAKTKKPKGKGRPKGSGKKSTNGFGSATGSNEAPCGFDVRLIWDDRDWAQWASSEQFSVMLSASSLGCDQSIGDVPIMMQDSDIRRDLDGAIAEGVICLIMKKKCDRHMGWQKTRENDFEAELSTLTRSLEKLGSDEHELRIRIEEQEQLSNFRQARSLHPKSFAPAVSPPPGVKKKSLMKKKKRKG
ncbi:hypothetical protein CROQUDRAFT_48667 [Cronartium quercuum f. sp. fusiforme G11]|uniref:PHD-type domain-containing protein n=1 Tax=Cronartium quercuum f. sp. fusiforme G11 TaxID=708437 RepID=A0A9P6NH95_9BASI|nr:hypothetical protein CROQUDRAFT_48667 [Cronartium quercuum f. sp. fusiforme G11]